MRVLKQEIIGERQNTREFPAQKSYFFFLERNFASTLHDLFEFSHGYPRNLTTLYIDKRVASL